MHVLIDHLAAMLIGSTVLLIFIVIQLRGSQAATEATVNHIVYREAVDLSMNLERDLENMLSPAQTANAISSGRLFPAVGAFTCQITTVNSPAGDLTTSFTFPTVADADSSVTSTVDPLTAQALQVVYNLTPTADSIDINIGNAIQRVPLHELERLVNSVVTGKSKGFMSQFVVETALRDSVGYTRTIGTNVPCPPTMTKIRFEYKPATDGVEFVTAHQRSTSRHNVSRLGLTVNLSNWENASP